MELNNKSTKTDKDLAKQLLVVLKRPGLYLGLDYTEGELIAYLQGICHGYRKFNDNSTTVISLSSKIWSIYGRFKNNDLIAHLIEELCSETN